MRLRDFPDALRHDEPVLSHGHHGHDEHPIAVELGHHEDAHGNRASSNGHQAADSHAHPAIVSDPFDAEVQRVGRQLFELSDFYTPPSWSPEAIRDVFLREFIGNEAIKLSALRFVDVFPAIVNDDERIAGHVAEYFGPMLADLQDKLNARKTTGLIACGINWGTSLATRLAEGSPGERKFVAWGSRFALKTMAKQFIAGATLEEVAPRLARVERNGFEFSLDLLGEAVISEQEAAAFRARYHDVLDRLEALMGPFYGRDNTAGPRVNISIKLTALVDHFDPIDPDTTSRDVRHYLRPLLRKAKARGHFVHVDMEKFAYRDLTARILRDVMMEDEFRHWEDIGMVHQAYLCDADIFLADWLKFLERRGTSMTIRLVKGAYWDSEQIWAGQKGWPVPVILRKRDTDAMYERCTKMLLDRYDVVRTAIGSHNIRSIAHAIAYAGRAHVPASRIEAQFLHGMAVPIRLAVRDLGIRSRVYTPCGELLTGMAYLVRRLLENTSQENFLMQKGAHLRSVDELLANPATN